MFRFHIVIDNNPPSPQLFLPMDRYEAEQVLYDLGLDGPGAVHDIEMYSDNSGIHIDPGKDSRTLNRLAQQIDQMDAYQRAAFEAWGSTQGACSVENALKACCHMDMLEFHPGFDSDELLGEFALDNEIFEEYKDLPEDTFAMLDRAKVGTRMREMDGGVLANGGYLVAEDVTGEEIPPEEPLPWFQVSFSGWAQESDWDPLPLSAEDEREIAGFFESDSLDGLHMECRYSIPQLSGITSEADELPGLRLLNEALTGMSQEEIQKYKVLLDVTKPENIGEAFRLAETLDRYDIALEYADPAVYGRQSAERFYHLGDVKLLRFIDFAGYGKSMLGADGYEATRYGAMYRNVVAQSILAGPNTVYSGDYYCGRTEGFPTCVCWDPDAQKVWLELDEGNADSELVKDFAHYQGICEDWGMRHCATQEDYEQIIRDLGAQPYDEVMTEEQIFGGRDGLMNLGNLTAVCDKNLWLGDYREYPAYDYGYSFEEIADLKTLAERFEHGNWSIRNGFLFGGFAFVQQVNGGDEWLALRQTAPGEWESFESISMEHILQTKGRYSFEKYVNRLAVENELNRSSNEIYVSQDFQCDVTDGFSTVLCYDQVKNQAWLEPSPALYDEDDPLCKDCIEACRAWGMRPCSSWEDFNDLLESIGDEAYENAAVEIEAEDQDFGGMGGMS